MSLINLALYNVSLCRAEFADGMEQQASDRTRTLKLRAFESVVGAKLREIVRKAFQPVVDLLTARISKLELQGKAVLVHPAATEQRVNAFLDVFLSIIPSLSPEGITKATANKSAVWRAFCKDHVQAEHYLFVVKKCGKIPVPWSSAFTARNFRTASSVPAASACAGQQGPLPAVC